MTIKTDTYETFDAVNIPEQVLDKITKIEREETPIYSAAKKRKIKTTSPEWQTQDLAAAGDNINVQGDEFTNDAATPTTRVKNHTQILQKVASVTRTNQDVAHYGYANEMDYQLGLKTIELRRDIERAIVQNNPSVAGSSGTGGEIGGIETWLESNVSRGAGGSNGGYNSGTGLTQTVTDGTQRVFTEDLLLGVLQTAYDNGASPTVGHVGSFNKQKMAGFSGNATRFSTDSKMASNTIDFYEGPFGSKKISIAINPRQRSRTALFYDMSKIGMLELCPIRTGKIAKTHDSEERFVLTELTTQVIEKGLAAVCDLTTS